MHGLAPILISPIIDCVAGTLVHIWQYSTLGGAMRSVIGKADNSSAGCCKLTCRQEERKVRLRQLLPDLLYDDEVFAVS